MIELTDKQKSIFNWMKNFYMLRGFPPTYREIATAFEITPKGAFDHVRAISKKGFIEITLNISRGIKFIKK